MEINKIYNEDCLQTMACMPDNFVDLTITSPPYNFNAGSGLGTKYQNTFKDNLSQKDYYEWSVNIINELMRVSKLVCYNIQMIAGNKEALMKLMGYFSKEIREIIIWDKKYSEPAINEKVFNSEFEFILILDKNGGGRKIEYAQFERGTVSNIIRLNKSKNSIKKKENIEKHLATFPDTLPSRLVDYFSKENDIIYDCFMGIGTTALSAIKYKRNWIGSEISKEYCGTAQKKIDNENAQLKLF